MIKKQLAIGRAISAIDAMTMRVPEVAVHDITKAVQAEPHVHLFRVMKKDVINMQISLAEKDLDKIEKLLY